MKELRLNDLKNRPELGWNVLLAVSVVSMLVAGWFAFLKPAPAGTDPKIAARIKNLDVQQRRAEELTASATVAIQKQGWNDSPEALGPKVLDLLTRLTDRDHVQLSGFRSERPVEVYQMREAPFVAVVEGPFESVMKLLNGLEAGQTRLGVNLLQLSASEIGLGHVTATLGIVAFLPREVK